MTALLLLRSFLFALSFLIISTKAQVLKYGQTEPTCPEPSDRAPEGSSYLSDFVSGLDLSNPVVIKCGERVVVDKTGTFNFRNGLVVDGELYFEDGGNGITISTAYILIRGHLRIGTSTEPFKSKIRIVLTDSGKDLDVPNTSGNRLFNQLTNFGRKVFVVYGGSVQIYGHVSGPTYTYLHSPAVQGMSRITVKGKLTGHWRKGDKIAVASTGYSWEEDSYSWFTVDKVFSRSGDISDVYIKEIVRKFHSVREVDLSNSKPPKIVSLAAEVAKTNRNIVISGLEPDNIDPENWLDTKKVDPIGAHFIIANSYLKQVVQGVEFVGMGQAGILGRYPIHFHFGSNVHPESRISSNSIHHSKQRCIVVHATNNLLIEKNVAFRTAGHCFLTEDGVESGNKFVENIGIAIQSAMKVIDKGGRNEQSDEEASVFWMSTPSNDLIRNVAAGSPSRGVWYQLRSIVTGQSRDMQLPGWNELDMSVLPFGTFDGNSAHSTHVGLATYPDGSFPLKKAILNGLFTWKVAVGWLTNIGRNQILRNAVILDVLNEGVFSHTITGVQIENSVIGGLLHYDWCDENRVIEGIHLEGFLHSRGWFDGMDGIILKNVHFQQLSKRRNCGRGVGLKIKMIQGDNWFSSASIFQKLSYNEVDQPIEIELPSKHRPLAFAVQNPGIKSVKGRGFMLSDGFSGQSMMAKNCIKLDASGLPKMLYCKKQCWRHIAIGYNSMKAYEPTSIRFTSNLGSFIVSPEEGDHWLEDTSVNRLVTQIMRSGNYDVEVIDKDGKTVPNSEYTSRSFYFYRPDSKDGNPSCRNDVILFVQGKEIYQTG